MIITLVVDNPKSWIVPYVKRLAKELKSRGHKVALVNDSSKIRRGDIAVWLSCEKIAGHKVLLRNKHNLVVHESALPQGRGWSPLTWQVLAGKNKIAITLFAAEEKVDSGQIYLQETMVFQGHELIDELREQQGTKTISLLLQFVDQYPIIKASPQKGKPSYYKRRGPADSELDINKSIKEQFNLLRVVDNKRYPAYFRWQGHTYILAIRKKND